MSVRTHVPPVPTNLAAAGPALLVSGGSSGRQSSPARRVPARIVTGVLGAVALVLAGPVAMAVGSAQTTSEARDVSLATRPAIATVQAGPNQVGPGGAGKPGGGGLTRPTAETLVKIDTAIASGTARAGETLELAVIMRIEPHWHVYWRNPGDSGAPVDITIKTAKDVTVGEIKWPRPTRFTNEFETTFGYEKDVALLVPIAIAPGATTIPSELTVDIRWMVCRDVCLTGSTTRTVALPSASPVLDEAQRLTIERSRGRLPKAIGEAGSGVTAVIEGATGAASTLIITGPVAPAQGAAALEFFPFDTPGVTYATARTSVRDGSFRVEVPLEINPGNALGKPLRTGGVVSLGADGPSYEFLLPVPSRSTTR